MKLSLVASCAIGQLNKHRTTSLKEVTGLLNWEKFFGESEDSYSIEMEEKEFNSNVSGYIGNLEFSIRMCADFIKSLEKEIRIKYMTRCCSLEKEYAVGINGFDLTTKWANEIYNSLHSRNLIKVGYRLNIVISFLYSKISIQTDAVCKNDMSELADYLAKN